MRPWSRVPRVCCKHSATKAMGLRNMFWMQPIMACPSGARDCSFFVIVSASLRHCITKRHGPKRSATSVLDRPGTWNRSPLDNGRRAAATLERAERGFAVLGRDTPFLIVYYGSDGAGGWQPLTVPLRTITTLDRFGLCEPSEDGPTLRMLQVPELARAMGFDEDLILKRGTRRDRVMLMGNGVCPPVMEAAVKALVGREQSDAQCDRAVDWLADAGVLWILQQGEPDRLDSDAGAGIPKRHRCSAHCHLPSNVVPHRFLRCGQASRRRITTPDRAWRLPLHAAGVT